MESLSILVRSLKTPLTLKYDAFRRSRSWFRVYGSFKWYLTKCRLRFSTNPVWHSEPNINMTTE